MSDETPTPKPVKEAEPEAKAAPAAAPAPSPIDKDAHEELIADYREKLRGKLPEAALKQLTLKALRETYKEIQAEEAKALKAKESEHPAEGRQGLPQPYTPPAKEIPELVTTEQGAYYTLPGFVESLNKGYEAGFPSAPFTTVTGPVGKSGFAPRGKKQSK